MPDGRRVVVYCEGSDDLAILKEFKKAGLLADPLELPAPEERPTGGHTGIVTDYCQAIRKTPIRAVILRDFDDLDETGVQAWFVHAVAGKGGTATPKSACCYTVRFGDHTSPVAVVPVGLRGGPLWAAEWRTIGSHAMDDYVLDLALDPEVWNKVKELHAVDQTQCVKKTHEIADLMEKNGMPIKKTKTIVHMLRGVAWVAASEAWFATRFAQAAGTERLREVFAPLLEDLGQAAAALAAD